MNIPFLSARSSGLLLWLLLVAIAVSFATSFSEFLHVKHNATALPEATSSVADREKPLPDIQAVAQSGWFGGVPDQIVTSGSGDVALKLELKGISKSEQSKLAGAFIAEHDQPESYYHIGDKLPNGAGIVTGIFSDHVTIQNESSVTTLKFDAAGETEHNYSNSPMSSPALTMHAPGVPSRAPLMAPSPSK